MPRGVLVTDDRTPQLEGGYVRVANALFDAWLQASSRLSKRESVVFMAVVRETYGWQRKIAPMTAATAARLTGFDASDCRKAISSLADQGLIVVENRGRKNQQIGPQKDHSRWFSGANHPAKRRGESPRKAAEGGANHPSKSGVNHPGSDTDPGRITPGKEGRITPDKRGESPRELELQPTDGAASSDPKDRKDSRKTTTEPPVVPLPAKKRGKQSVSVELMQQSLPGLSEGVAQDYLAMRKAKRAPLTETAWKAISASVREACRELGHSPDRVLAYAQMRSWVGFQLDWYRKGVGVTPNGGSHDGPQARFGAAAEPRISEADRTRNAIARQRAAEGSR